MLSRTSRDLRRLAADEGHWQRCYAQQTGVLLPLPRRAPPLLPFLPLLPRTRTRTRTLIQLHPAALATTHHTAVSNTDVDDHHHDEGKEKGAGAGEGEVSSGNDDRNDDDLYVRLGRDLTTLRRICRRSALQVGSTKRRIILTLILT